MKGCVDLGKFNLIDEPWITVITDKKGNTKNVSLKELFKSAQSYKKIAGDSRAQDFAVLRVILAVLHTVFSRFNSDGKSYGYFETDEKLRQKNIIDDDDLNDYIEDLYETWINLWNKKEFPDIIYKYLEIWHDRFYLFDEECPFFQVRKEDISPDKINRSKPTKIPGKNINRLISESGNKISLFSPKYEGNKETLTEGNKEILTPSEIIRWLITFQGYTGLSDKVIFGKEKYKSSKGWLFDIGGIYLEGENLFETLLLNFVLIHPKEEYIKCIQKPCWEYESKDLLEFYKNLDYLDNISSLYTIWSRAIYIDPDIDLETPFSFDIVKLPDLNHQNQFLEPMTIWRFNEDRVNKNTYTPKKHIVNQSMWRSFGLIAMPDSDDNNIRQPGIIEWLNDIESLIHIGDKITINSISMRDDGNATSWVPIDEIHDSLSISEIILTDVSEAGWVPRINDVVEETKNVIDRTYRIFIYDIKEIRNLESKEFVNQNVEDLYFMVDKPFRDWISSINPNDLKDEKINEWRSEFKNIVLKQADKILSQAGPRDYIGIEKDKVIKNIATSYSSFKYFLNNQLVIKEDKNDQKDIQR